MIGKRIRRTCRQPRGSRASIAASVQGLVRYVTDTERHTSRGVLNYIRDHRDLDDDAPGEKVLATGTYNLVGSDVAHWQVQMQAAADQCRRGRDPVEHYVLSWHRGEQPDEPQCAQAVEIVLQHLGLKDCPAAWAAHGNTNHRHVHIAVVRYDLRTGRMAGLGWDIDQLHRALALIEYRQGWRSEPNACYFVEQGRLFDSRTKTPVRMHHAHDGGERRNERQKIAEEGPEIVEIRKKLSSALQECPTWEIWHQRMRQSGLRYERKGSGAIVSLGSKCFKASAIGREYTFTQMQKALGPYEPPSDAVTLGYEQYLESWRSQLTRLRDAHHYAKRKLEAGRVHDRASIDALEPSDGDETVKTFILSGIERECKAAGKGINEAFARAKAELAQKKLTREKWLAADKPAAIPNVSLPQLFFPSVAVAAPGIDPKSHAPSVRGRLLWATEYRDTGDNIAFIDYRRVIVVEQIDHAAVSTALTLAAERWGKITVTGDAVFLDLCAKIAAERGYEISDASGKRLWAPQASKSPSVTEPAPHLPQDKIPAEMPVIDKSPVTRGERPKSEIIAEFKAHAAIKFAKFRTNAVEVVEKIDPAGIPRYSMPDLPEGEKHWLKSANEYVGLRPYLLALYEIQQAEQDRVVQALHEYRFQIFPGKPPLMHNAPDEIVELADRWFTSEKVKAALDRLSPIETSPLSQPALPNGSSIGGSERTTLVQEFAAELAQGKTPGDLFNLAARIAADEAARSEINSCHQSVQQAYWATIQIARHIRDSRSHGFG